MTDAEIKTSEIIKPTFLKRGILNYGRLYFFDIDIFSLFPIVPLVFKRSNILYVAIYIYLNSKNNFIYRTFLKYEILTDNTM